MQVTKYHPSSVDLELTKNLISNTRAKTIVDFLHTEFDCIHKDYAREIILGFGAASSRTFTSCGSF